MELLILGGVVSPNNHCDIENFLCANGCENLVPGFIAEEIEVRQIAQLSDQDLISLGVRTIGARLRLCSAAASWEPPQVYFVIFQRSSDFMISVTYFALENIAMSKVDVHQDQGGKHEHGQGQVR